MLTKKLHDSAKIEIGQKLQRNGDIPVFIMAVYRHIGFSEIQSFNDFWLRDPLCTSVQNFVQIGPCVAAKS